jgi:uncharacterized lipoprotein NlpE involved in copper resistance
MKYIKYIFPVLLVGCNNAHNLPENMTFPASYSGVIPCGDCPGIKYELVLDETMEYTEELVFIGKSDDGFTTSGKWFVVDDSTIRLDKDHEGMEFFRLVKGNLLMLDKDAQRITGSMATLYFLKPGTMEDLVIPEQGIPEIQQ